MCAQTGKNGYIDMNYIYQNLVEIKQTENQLSAMEQQNRQELDSKSKQLKAQREKIQMEKKEITAEENKSLADELEQFDQLAATKNEELSKKRQASFKIVEEKIKKAIQDTAIEKGYSAIMDISTVVYYDPKDEITKIVLQKLTSSNK